MWGCSRAFVVFCQLDGVAYSTRLFSQWIIFSQNPHTESTRGLLSQSSTDRPVQYYRIETGLRGKRRTGNTVHDIVCKCYWTFRWRRRPRDVVVELRHRNSCIRDIVFQFSFSFPLSHSWSTNSKRHTLTWHTPSPLGMGQSHFLLLNRNLSSFLENSHHMGLIRGVVGIDLRDELRLC